VNPGQFFRNPLWRGPLLGLICAVSAWLLTRADIVRGVEDWMFDGCFSWRGKRPTRANIVIIGLDEPSLDALHKPAAYLSPELAEVVTYAHAQGATAIGVDVLVPDSMTNDLEKSEDGNPWFMFEAINRAGNVVLPVAQLGDEPTLPPKPWRLKSIDQQPTDLAFVNLSGDGDHFVRRQQLLAVAPKVDEGESSRDYVPQFAYAVYLRAHGAPRICDDEGRPLAESLPVPLEGNGTLRINFVGPPDTFDVISFQQALTAARAGQAIPRLQGAIVLIGATSHSLQDYHATPYSNLYTRWLASKTPNLMSGPELHANIIATLEDRAFIRTPWWLSPLPLLLIVGPLLGYAFSRLNLQWGFVLALAHHFAWKGLALAAFSLWNYRIHVVSMLLLGFLAYTVTFLLRWRRMRLMFGLVKSEAVARALEADPRRLDPGGEEREITVFFADIRGFTAFSEKHPPREVVALLNTYFSQIVPLIERAGGTINSYMGDGIMVLFGAPASCPDPTLSAVRAACAIVRRIHQQRELWARLGKPDLRIGVGIHTGRAVVGAIGSRGRLDYTAIGDTVNTAARIESENKKAGTEILISSAAHEALPPAERTHLGIGQPIEVTVPGKDKPLLVYSIPVERDEGGESTSR
jgi:adenylate cyclase